jgi:hypothetical protein
MPDCRHFATCSIPRLLSAGLLQFGFPVGLSQQAVPSSPVGGDLLETVIPKIAFPVLRKQI